MSDRDTDHEGGRATHRFKPTSLRCSCGAELTWLEDEELVCPRQRDAAPPG